MTGRVTIGGLGPGGADLITAATLHAARTADVVVLRTRHHPAAGGFLDAVSCDDLYESADRIDDVYPAIVERLVSHTADVASVLYLVPGSPRVAERSVDLLVADERVEVEVLAAMSFLELVWDRVGVDPIDAGVRLVDGHRFASDAAGVTGPMLVSQVDHASVLADIVATVIDGPDVVVLQRLGLADERVETVPWDDLGDRVEPDPLTSLWVPPLAAPVGAELVAFADLVATLRVSCPWDRSQTHETLTRHLLEEAHEVVDAISGGDPDHLCEELGDLLFQVYFHAQIASESGAFDLADVARGINDKLTERHPHVFGDVTYADADEQAAAWERSKRAKKGRASVLDGVPTELPALLAAHKTQRKAASVGFDWPTVDGAWAKVTEEIAEVHADPSVDEVGDLLFAVVNVARHLKVDPETALRTATARFSERFRGVETLAAERGIDLETASIEVLDGLWDEVKGAARA